MDELLNAANEVFVAILAMVILYLGAVARSYLKRLTAQVDSNLDDAARVRLEQALERAISKAETKGQQIDLHDVISYVQRFNPGDVARFRLRSNDLAERASAAIAARSSTSVKKETDANA